MQTQRKTNNLWLTNKLFQTQRPRRLTGQGVLVVGEFNPFLCKKSSFFLHTLAISVCGTVSEISNKRAQGCADIQNKPVSQFSINTFATFCSKDD